MFAQFLSIVFRSIKLDKNLYRESKSFGEAAIYFAALVMVLDGVAGAIAANTIYKTSIGLSAITAIFTWFVWAIFIFVIGVKLFPDKNTNVPFDGTINKNGFPKGNVGDKFKVHLPKKYCEKGSNPVDAVVVDIPFTESYNPNTREVAK